MSAGLMIAAGYMVDLPQAHRLAFMKLCDSADDRTRIAYPGLDAVRIWAGVKKAQGQAILADLQDRGLLMQVTSGYRGHRAEYKVFPAAGDETLSLAAKQGKPCPGADKFSGPVAIPQGEDEIARLLAVIDNRKPAAASSRANPPARRKGSDSPDPSGKGLTPQTQSPERVQSGEGKGPVSQAKGSDSPDPFGSFTSFTTSSSDKTAPASQSPGSDALFDVAATPTPPPADETLPQKAERVLSTWWTARKTSGADLPTQSYPTVKGIVTTALKNNHPEADVIAAVDSLVAKGKAISGGTLRIEMTELAKRQGNRRRAGDVNSQWEDGTAAAKWDAFLPTPKAM